MELFDRTDFGHSVAYYFLAAVIESILVAHTLYQVSLPSIGFMVSALLVFVLLIGSSVTWLTKASMTFFKFYNPKAVSYVMAFYLLLMILICTYLVDLLKGLV